MTVGSVERGKELKKEEYIEGINRYILQTSFIITSKKYSNSSRQNKNCRSRDKVQEHFFSSTVNNITTSSI
jgi:hypothetical protein